MSDKCSIYKITNLSNGLNYIGCTIGTVEERFKTHIYRCYNQRYNTKLYNSIRKYGKENFIVTLIEECDVEYMYDREKHYIEKYDTFNNGLNSTIGGEGCLGYTHSEYIRKKISESVKEGNSHKGKTYDSLYGENADAEKLKRKTSVKKRWDSLSEEDKSNRMKKTIEKARSNSKVGIETVKEIKEEIKKGLTNKELKEKYPGIEYTLFSQLRHNRRWKNI
jgi:group I intron endonuclease